MSLFLCMVLESDLVSFFYKWWPVFPTPLVKEIVLNPLYILASFVEDKVSIGVWINLWAFFFDPLIYISVFVPVPYCLDGCGFVVEPEVRQVDSSSSILLSQDCFVYSRFFCISIQIDACFNCLVDVLFVRLKSLCVCVVSCSVMSDSLRPRGF